jgi:hypothetical protein
MKRLIRNDLAAGNCHAEIQRGDKANRNLTLENGTVLTPPCTLINLIEVVLRKKPPCPYSDSTAQVNGALRLCAQCRNQMKAGR